MQKNNLRQQAFSGARSRSMLLLVIAVVAASVAITAYRVISPQASQPNYAQITTVTATPGAALSIDREEAELGVLAVADVGRATFHLTNTGSAPVEISRVRTSCMCTFAKIDLPGGKSPEFNMAMHNDAATNAWKGILGPGEQAVVTIIYKPALMPVEGSVARNVKFATNDPKNPVVELGVHATVKGGVSGQ